MTRTLASLLVIGLVAGAAPACAQTLRPVATVSGSVVHLSDIFADAGSHAGDVVVQAPPVGTRITYGSDWLAAVAREHWLGWRPQSSYDQVTIERLSRDIGSDAVVERLMGEIAARESIDGATLELDNPGLHLIVPADAPPAIAIDGLSIDRRSGRISAIVSAPAGDPAAVRHHVTGRLVFQVEVPVLSHAVAAGATLSADDIDMTKMRRDRVAADVAIQPTQMIGKATRRPIQAGTPVRLGDLEAPILVHKGDLVTIQLATATLQISVQGKALEDGAKGALVQVANTKSNRVIDAAVVAPGTVAVTAPGAPQTALR